MVFPHTFAIEPLSVNVRKIRLFSVLITFKPFLKVSLVVEVGQMVHNYFFFYWKKLSADLQIFKNFLSLHRKMKLHSQTFILFYCEKQYIKT